ncbi:MAG TPA: hypothetical protein PLX35_14270 [Cyclobacteriaceae bacterium]|nr:hypothetical protein [Cyclobacteriaceae bacterium]
MKLRLSSKRLASGRFQVNFSADGFEQPCYGYLLADATSTVSDVVSKISRHVQAMQTRDTYFQRNLYSLSTRNIHSGRILVFPK